MRFRPTDDAEQHSHPSRRRSSLTALAVLGASAALVASSVSASAAPADGQAPLGQAEAKRTAAVLSAAPRLEKVAPAQRLIPAPVSLRQGDRRAFELTKQTRIAVSGDARAKDVANLLAETLRPATGFPVPVAQNDRVRSGSIVLRVRPAKELPGADGPEAYRLDVQAERIVLESTTAEGLYRGVQTLRQLMPPQIESPTRQGGRWTVPAVEVTDSPRFSYRGAMLDVARHFLTVDEVKRYIDDIALYKMNTLHLHLADDQGWRLEIEGWPRLTTVGGTTEVGGGPGGWYTQQDYKEIVDYAAERFVTVVPEIDTPGHTNAAQASYPELNCDGVAPPLYNGIDVGFSSLCIDNETTYEFLDDVIGQLADLTPGPYLHLGGDEAHSTDEEDYVRFIERVESIVQDHGKQMMGWAEISTADIDPSTVSQYWNPAAGDAPGTSSAVNAVAQDSKLVMSPANKAYLDMKYTALTPLGLQWAGLVEVSDSYAWDPVSYVSGVQESDVLGVEAALWTETIKDIDDAEYMAFPRLPGIAEKGWSRPEGRTWEEYRTRLANQSPRWEVLGVNFYCSPQVDWAYCRVRPTPPTRPTAPTASTTPTPPTPTQP